MMLDGMKAICGFLGEISPKKVRALIRAGAPVRVYGNGLGTRYFADSRALRRWVRSGEERTRAAKSGNSSAR